MQSGNSNRSYQSIGEVIHKEKNQKKYNKTTGQHDNLKKYSTADNSSRGNLATDDKQIRREANYMKNLHIDAAYQSLIRMNLVTDPKYEAWWCGVLHKLGVQFVMAQADKAIKNARDPENPSPLFHFLINKAMNQVKDPFMPRFNLSERSDR